jgi:hypothetical protein
MLLAIGHLAPGDMHCVWIIPATLAIEAAFPVPQKTLPKWPFPLLFDESCLVASTKFRFRTLSSPPQGLHRDDAVCLFRGQTQMEPSFDYPTPVGRYNFRGDKNNSSGSGCLTLEGICPSQSTIILFSRRSTKKETNLSFRQTRCKRSSLALPPRLCLATAVFLASTLLATRGQGFHQMYHRSWTVREDATSSVTSIAQSADGFLWLGGEDGYIESSTLDSNE